MQEKTYYEQQDNKNTEKIKHMLQGLPTYCEQYAISIEKITESKTRTAYLYDLISWFEFLQREIEPCKGLPITDITLEMTECVQPQDIEKYLLYLRHYEKNGREYTNGQSGIKRKLASLRAFYAFLYSNKLIRNNPAAKVKIPKVHKETLDKLEKEEICKLLREVGDGSALTARQRKYHERTKDRDLAIMMLLLGAGIRVSECVGINIKDIDFENMGVYIHRKRGVEVIIYFNKEVRNALLEYYKRRIDIIANKGSTDAFFLSITGNRLSVRSVEALVTKYAKMAADTHKITPHKLRSALGCAQYRCAGDIFLTVNTSKDIE